MQGIFNHTHGDLSNWRNDLIKYKEDKQKLSWDYTEKPRLVTHKTMKGKDDEFNPILQIYRDKQYENQIKLMSKMNLRDTLARNKDKSLRIEQTYNVITLENKLKGLNNMDKTHNNTKLEFSIDGRGNNYKTKSRAKSNMLINSKVNYNILSNIPVDKQSSLQPESRQITDEIAEPKRVKKLNANYYRDYNIISNNYKEYHEEKTYIDKEISHIETAKKYHKKNDYNPIRAEYYDQDREKEFQFKREEKTKNWEKESKRPKYNLTGYLYNPINMSVINESGLKESDAKALNKKKRYQLRSLVDVHYHTSDMEKSKQKDEKVLNKISYNRFKVFDDRGFDILNQDVKNEKEYKALNPKIKDLRSDWERLKQNIGENGNLDIKDEKNVYKDPHDYSDMAKTTKEFMVNRKSMLEKLPKIKDDSIFNKKNSQLKIINKKYDNDNTNSHLYNPKEFKRTNSNFRNFNNTHAFAMNKDEWFKTNKNNFYSKDTVETVNYYQDGYIATPDSYVKSRPTLFIENKVKRLQEKI